LLAISDYMEPEGDLLYGQCTAGANGEWFIPRRSC